MRCQSSSKGRRAAQPSIGGFCSVARIPVLLGSSGGLGGFGEEEFELSGRLQLGRSSLPMFAEAYLLPASPLEVLYLGRGEKTRQT